jgi:hypothetical protein
MRYGCCACVYMRFQSRQDIGRTGVSLKERPGAHVTYTLCFRGWVNQFGTNLTRVVDLADTNLPAVHRNLVEFLVLRRSGSSGDRTVTRCRSSHGATTLWARPWRVGTAVFAMSDPQVGIVGLIFDTFDGLDGVTDVGKVDKCAVLFFEKVDELDITVLAKVAL